MSSQIKKKFIEANAIDGSKIQIENDEALRIKKSGGSDQDVLKLDTLDKLQFMIAPRVSLTAAEVTDSDMLTPKGYVDQKIADLVNGAPALLDTLNELAAAIGNDENFSTTFTNAISNLQSQIDDLESTGIGSVQAELDATQVGAGLGTDGSYSAPMGSNYLGAAVSLKDADSLLDTQLKVVADDLAQEVLDRIADVDAEESARIAEDLTFLKLDGSRQMAADLEFASTPGGESSVFATSGSYDNTQHTFLANPVRALSQTFVAPSAMSLSKVNFRLKRDGSAAGTVNIIAKLVAYSGGTFGSVLATSSNSVDHNSLPNDPYGDAVAQLVSFNFSPVALSSGQTYAVVLAVQGGILNTSNFLTVNVKALRVVGTSYADGSVVKIQDDTDYNASPIVDTNYDLFMEVFESVSAQSYQIKGIAAPTMSSDAANKGYVDSAVDAEETRALAAEGVIAGNLAQEILDRAADVDAEELRAMNAESAIQSELDATQSGAGLGTDGAYTAPVGSNYLGSAVSLKDADSKLDTEIKVVADDLAQEILDRIADVDAEESRAMGVESGLQTELDTTQVGAGLGSDGSYTAPVGSNYLGSAVSLKDADSELDAQVKIVADGLAQEILDRIADVDAEQSARESEDLTMLKLDGSRPMTGSLSMANHSITGVSSLELEPIGNMSASATAELITLTDTDNQLETQIFAGYLAAMDLSSGYEIFIDSSFQGMSSNGNMTISSNGVTPVSLLLDSATGQLQISGGNVSVSSNKVVDVADGVNANDAINKGQLDSVESSLASDIAAEETRALAAEGVIQGYVDALEAASVQFVQQKFTLSAGDISNGYIDLSNAAYSASINAFVDRLAIHETDDYTVSTVGGVTRITFAGSLITAGQEKLSAGDVVRVKYAKVAIV